MMHHPLIFILPTPELLENGLVRDAPSELHATVLAAMLAVAARHRTAFIQAFAGRCGGCLFGQLAAQHADTYASCLLNSRWMALSA